MSSQSTVPASEVIPASELSDLELLAQALQEAMDARATGVIGGPAWTRWRCAARSGGPAGPTRRDC